ncbi:oligosaccharide flippase family protein [Methanoculleus sp.]|uniref:oligosaccharide flippase family protein n=1 Tax=Methanoculleus sp. TaxID=90427 RepID=UPI001BD6BB90|nr:oligosaccharide flippase family protein [Methanoculleus sp.]
MQRQSVIQGTTYLLIAQIIFLLSGYVVHIGLGRTLGPASYGIYTVVISIATVINLFLTTGIPQATSKYISENPIQAKRVLRSSLKISVLFSLALSGVVIASADGIAYLLQDQSLAFYIPIVALMIVATGPRTVTVAYFNGIGDYKVQSILVGLYNVLKPVLILLLVFLGFSTFGAIVGFALSPVIPLIIGLFLVGRYTVIKSEHFPIQTILLFAAPIIVLSATINLILNLDLFFVKGILIDNVFTGYYSASAQIAKIPYFLMAAVTAALFPAVSASMHEHERVQNYISESLRYALLFILPGTAMVAATSTAAVTLIYSDIYQPAGAPLTVLIVGMCLFGIFALLTTIVSAVSRPGVAMAMGIGVLAVDFALNWLMVPAFGMVGAAGATTLSCTFGLGIAAAHVYWRYQVLMPVASAAKILAASLLVFIALYSVPVSGPMLLVAYGAAGVGYFLVLYLMDEIQERDIERLRRLIPGRGITVETDLTRRD